MRLRNATIFVLFLVLPAAARGDIMKLDTGEVLNGKIIQQSSDNVVFASSAKTLTVPRKSIVEVFKTSSPDEDRKLLEKLGKRVSAEEIKINYKAGEEKLEQFLSTGIIVTPPPAADGAMRGLSVYGGAGRNTGSFSSTLPRGFYGGARFLTDACAGETGFRWSFTGDLFGCRFARRGKSLTGGVLTAGCLLGWQTGYGCPFVSGSAGPGVFRIDNAKSAVVRLKPAAHADAGLILFVQKNIMLTPVLRTVYVYDRDRSLTGISVLMMAGAAL